MEVNADFTQRAIVHAAALPWVPSPTPGIERRMLDRIGGEVARATSIVRYAPQSSFPPHVHGGGEEILVLDGVFSDETGDFPAGAYVRNPPGSAHRPGSAPGCTIFVKLWQFDPEDRLSLRIGPEGLSFAPVGPGVDAAALYAGFGETVRIERWAPGARIGLEAPGGLELLVLAGEFTAGEERFQPLSWLRLPPGDRLAARAGADGCRMWVKSGHLARPRGLRAAASAAIAAPG